MFENSLFSDFFGERRPSDIIELDDKVKLKVPVPGIEKDKIEINFVGGYLLITAGDPKGNIADHTIPKGYKYKFSYSTKLDIDNIKAKLDLGILTVDIPYKENSQRKIVID